MSRALRIHRAGPSLTVQDFGRIGFLEFGLSCGGAADPLALTEGAALLGQGLEHAALEMAGFGGEFEATGEMRIALTGAPMVARLDDAPLLWNASHRLQAGQRLSIGAPQAGMYGYLSIGGGIDFAPFLGSRSTHLAGGIGQTLRGGDSLTAGHDAAPDNFGNYLSPSDRFSGGNIRILPSAQTDLFSAGELDRFTATTFTRGARGNRQGVALEFDGCPFAAAEQLFLLSEIMVVGDIQMTGEGAPFILLPECQTTGGYPRIGTVVPDDLPRMAQAAPGTVLKFDFVTREVALKAHVNHAQNYRALMGKIAPLIRDPHDIRDLLSYQLISGVTAGSENHDT